MGCHANQDSICFEAFNITLSMRIELPGQSGVWEAHGFGPLSLARDPGADRDHDHRERHPRQRSKVRDPRSRREMAGSGAGVIGPPPSRKRDLKGSPPTPTRSTSPARAGARAPRRPVSGGPGYTRSCRGQTPAGPGRR